MTQKETSAPQHSNCANCGDPLTGRFCAKCGQDAHVQLTVRHFFEEVVEGLLHLESTFWRTFRPLLFRPGLMTQQYLAGRRKHYAPPFRTYLVISVIYFLLSSVFAAQLVVKRMSGEDFGPQSCAILAQNLQWLSGIFPDIQTSCVRAHADEGRTLQHAIVGLFPRVMFVVLPLVALVQYWIQRRRRSLYVENLVFVLHFQSFYYVVGSVFFLLAGGVSAALGPNAFDISGWLSTVLLVWSAIYLYLAIRRVYGSGVIKTLFNLLAIAVAYSAFWALGVTITTLLVILRS
jgi:hypothetical protein